MSLSKHDLSATAHLYGQHGCMKTVARILGISPSAVRYRLDKAGVSHDSRPGPKPWWLARKRAMEARAVKPMQRAARPVWSPADIRHYPEA